jgi:hypothetical protein
MINNQRMRSRFFLLILLPTLVSPHGIAGDRDDERSRLALRLQQIENVAAAPSSCAPNFRYLAAAALPLAIGLPVTGLGIATYVLLDREIDRQSRERKGREATAAAKAEEKALADRAALAIKESKEHFEKTGDIEPLLRAITFFTNQAAEKTGRQPIGLGWILDLPEIEATLSRSEKTLLSDPRGREIAAAEIFCRRLYGDSGDLPIEDGPQVAGRPVSSLFEGKPGPRGVCRDKALALQALLRHYGIVSKLRVGWLPASNDAYFGTHVWVELTKSGYVLDPMNFRDARERSSYLREYVRFYLDDKGQVLSPDGDDQGAAIFQMKRILTRLESLK